MASVQSFTFELKEDYADDGSNDVQEDRSSAMGESIRSKEEQSFLSPNRGSTLPPWGRSSRQQPAFSSTSEASASTTTPASYQKSYESNMFPSHYDPTANRQEAQRGSPGEMDDECFAVVSAETLYSQVPDDSDWDMYRDSFLAAWREFMFEQKDNEDDDDDDDDDDNNDGSCSILSNTAVYQSSKAKEARAQVAVGGGDSDGDESSSVGSTRSNAGKRRRRRQRQTSGGSWQQSTALLKHGKQVSSAPGLNAAVQLRGGGSNSAIGSEVAKRLFVSAMVTVAYEACCGHILEFIKSTFVLLSVAANNGFPMNMMMMQ